ncbi:MAG: outer membrane protein assembly factor BamA [candidate division Zixibacteria bacterium]|nr:outer membrane protein assembly factor BamA [candidate division Zixibacteria bacterium]
MSLRILWKSRFFFILFFCLAVLSLTDAVNAQGNYTVVDLEVEGNRVATKSLIMGVSSIDKGSPLTPTDIQETIHRLYGLGIFSDVEIKAEEVLGGLKIYIIVRELPKLIGLNFEGNKKINNKDLKEKLGLGVGGYISPYLIFQKKQEIRQAYSEKGYFQAEVTHQLEYGPDSTEASLKYIIKENPKVKVEKVIMTGNQRVEANDLIKKMRNRKRGFLKSSDFAQEKYEEDLEKVITEYHKKGFIDAYLISDSMTIDTATNRMTIYLEVYEGPQYYFGTASFVNNEQLPEKVLNRALKYEEGEIFNQEKYEESLFELYTSYQEIGYLHTRILDEKQTRSDTVLDITYDITEGLPSHINLVKIVGNVKTKDKVIRREISALPGQVFNRSRLIRSVRDVMALNFFNNVEPVPIDLPNGDVDIEFKIEEKQTAQISAGAGYNSTDKLVGSFGMGIPNFRGNGQSLSFNTDFGSRRNSFSISFTEPWLFGRPTLLGVNIYTLNRRWYEDYTEARQGGSIRLGRRLRWPDNYFRVYASYRLERNRFHDYDEDFIQDESYKALYYSDANNNGILNIYDDTIDSVNYYAPYPGSIISYNEEWNTASRLSFTITRDSRNLPQFATKGSVLSYTFENTGGFLGGFWHYQKHQLTVSKFIPLIWGMALAAKVEYGMVTSPSGDDRILVTDRFNPGGTAYDGIVRGYDDGVLTPDSLVVQSDTVFFKYYSEVDSTDKIDTLFDETTTRVRGKYMLVSNFELQIPIAKNQLYALLFFDAGNSWLHHEDIKPITDLYKGIGFGFRIMIPGMGTIGFDFGYPLDNYRDEDKGWKPHFQYGTTF